MRKLILQLKAEGLWLTFSYGATNTKYWDSRSQSLIFQPQRPCPLYGARLPFCSWRWAGFIELNSKWKPRSAPSKGPLSFIPTPQHSILSEVRGEPGRASYVAINLRQKALCTSSAFAFVCWMGCQTGPWCRVYPINVVFWTVLRRASSPASRLHPGSEPPRIKSFLVS